MKCRIYRITLNNGDWYEVATSNRNWALDVLLSIHFDNACKAAFRRKHKPKIRATKIYTDRPGPIRSNTYEAD